MSELGARKDKWADVKKWFIEKQAQTVIKNLEKNYMKGFYVPNREEARKKIMEMIEAELSEGGTIGWGGSVTLRNLGILRDLQKNGKYECLNPFRGLVSDEEKHVARVWMGVEGALEKTMDAWRKCLSADVYLTSTNAITLKGAIVNCDGYGNRVAAMMFGPKKVIVVTGYNKIVKDIPEALERVKNMVTPKLVKMMTGGPKKGEEKFFPACVRLGRCAGDPRTLRGCGAAYRACGMTSIIEQPHTPDRITVIIIGEELGF